MASKTAALVLASMVVIFAIGLGMGWAFQTTISPSSASQPSTSQSGSGASAAQPYRLSVMEIMGNEWNSTAGMQPKFLVEGNHGLTSSESITFPVRRVIQLTITAFDTPTPNSTAAEARVTGTVGGTVFLINGTIASMSDAGSVMVPWGQNVTSVPASTLAHTFTISQLGINIPVVGGSTVIAYLYFDKPGTYTWVCLTPCGLGDNGLAGAMDAPGWMTGTVVVS